MSRTVVLTGASAGAVLMCVGLFFARDHLDPAIAISAEASATTPKLRPSRARATRAKDLRCAAASPNHAWLS